MYISTRTVKQNVEPLEIGCPLKKGSPSEDNRGATLFAETLNELSARYSVTAGYVVILFGGARRGDDIDFITYPLAENSVVGGFGISRL